MQVGASQGKLEREPLGHLGMSRGDEGARAERTC